MTAEDAVAVARVSMDIERSVARAREARDRLLLKINAMHPNGVPTNGVTKTIMIVEDDEEVARGFERVLRVSVGAKFEWYGNGRYALQAARRHLYDLLIVDLGLPGELTGIDLVREVRAVSLCPSVPVLVVSAIVNEQELEQAAVGCGATAWTLKSVSAGVMREVVCRLLDTAPKVADTVLSNGSTTP